MLQIMSVNENYFIWLKIVFYQYIKPYVHTL